MTSALLSSAFVFGYGGFTMMMYAVRAILNGTFFKGTTEKETLELQMGKCSPLKQRVSEEVDRQLTYSTSSQSVLGLIEKVVGFLSSNSHSTKWVQISLRLQ